MGTGENYKIKWFNGAVATKIIHIISTEDDDVLGEKDRSMIRFVMLGNCGINLLNSLKACMI